MSASLLALRGRALANALRRTSPLAAGPLALLGLALVWAEAWGAGRGLTFLGGFGPLGLAVARRLLDVALTVLASGVAFSAVTVAIQTLYLSEDLNFLLALPVPTWRVFALKLAETFAHTALVAGVLTLPLVAALGAVRHAPVWFYPLAVLVTLLVYALPVGLGGLVAVLLMRVAPLSRVREVATALGVVLSAALVYAIRALQPEALLRQAQTPAGLDGLLHSLSGSPSPLLPSAWAASALWEGAAGHLSPALLPLLLASALVLGGAAWLAAHAYQAGWARGLDSSRLRLDPRPRPLGRAERLARRLGPVALLVHKDLRLAARDPTQWSQLLVLLALAGVYLVSLRAVPTLTPQFADTVGFAQLALQGFVVAGVALRLAFPAVSLEARTYWLLRTGPLSARTVVMAKFLGALPPTLALSLGLSLASARLLEVDAAVSFAALLCGLTFAPLLTALGVGLGAALPRFAADNPAEIGLSAGGLLSLGLGLVASLLTVGSLARPTFLAVLLPALYPGLSAFATPTGLLCLTGWLALTVLGTWGALAWGARQLERHE